MKMQRVAEARDKLLAEKMQKLADHNARVGKDNAKARIEAKEIEATHAVLAKHEKAAERAKKVLEERKAKAAAMANKRSHLKKQINDKLDTAEQQLKESEFQLVESYLGKAMSMSRMANVEESMEFEAKEEAPRAKTLNRDDFKKMFAEGEFNPIPEIKNMIASSEDVEMSDETAE